MLLLGPEVRESNLLILTLVCNTRLFLGEDPDALVVF